MTQNKVNQPNWLQYITGIIVALLIIGMFSGWGNSEPTDLSAFDAKIVDLQNSVNNIQVDDRIDKLCELTDGCDVYEITGSDKSNAINDVEDYLTDNNDRKLRTFMEDIVDLDRDDFEIKSIDRKDAKVTAATENDKDDENYEVSLVLRVKYKDEDASDPDYVYVMVTADIVDGIDVENVNVVETDRGTEL